LKPRNDGPMIRIVSPWLEQARRFQLIASLHEEGIVNAADRCPKMGFFPPDGQFIGHADPKQRVKQAQRS
jgi:hypothetical protein